MTPAEISLDDIRIAAPCTASWDEMSGGERVRHCALCKKYVYNLSAMTRADAETLIKEKEGRCCVRFYRRADGTVLTENCPVGLQRIQRRMRVIAVGAAAAFSFLTWGLISARAGGSANPDSFVRQYQPFKALMDWIDPLPAPQTLTMGKMPMPVPTVVAPSE